MGSVLELTNDQKEHLLSLEQERARTDGNYSKAYAYLHSVIEEKLSQQWPKDSNLKDVKYWLEKANEINSNDPRSTGNAFIRGVTKHGADWDGKPLNGAGMQEASNAIGRSVINDAIKGSGIPDIKSIVSTDATVAVNSAGLTPGGWGGSFYYWDSKFGGTDKTVGQLIIADPKELEKFIAVNAEAAADVYKKFGSNLLENAETALSAQAPIGLKAEIYSRRESILAGGPAAGNADNIDGYRYSPKDKPNWYLLQHGGFGATGMIVIPPAEKAAELDARRQIRLEHGGTTKFRELRHGELEPQNRSDQPAGMRTASSQVIEFPSRTIAPSDGQPAAPNSSSDPGSTQKSSIGNQFASLMNAHNALKESGDSTGMNAALKNAGDANATTTIPNAVAAVDQKQKAFETAQAQNANANLSQEVVAAPARRIG